MKYMYVYRFSIKLNGCCFLGKVSAFGTQEKQRGLGIQVTDRSTHQVMSRIFLMFLTEVLDYKDVQLIPIHFKNGTDPRNALQTLQYVR